MSILDEAIKARNKFLKDHPELEHYQKEIDELLEKTPNKYKIQVLAMLITSKINELSDNLIKLMTALESRKE